MMMMDDDNDDYVMMMMMMMIRAATWRVKCGQISERLSQLTIHSTSYL